MFLTIPSRLGLLVAVPALVSLAIMGAARAGDAGRGFAVVASEVRALAQRSAEAAREIKGLISASTQQVGSGVKLVGETGQALGRIVAQVGEVAGVVAAIAASAQDQARGLAEVNTAMGGMDQVTRQNAAMVEQTTAAARALAGEAQALASLTSRFRLEADTVESLFVLAQRTEAQRGTAAKAPQLRAVGQGGRAAARKLAPAATEGWEKF